MTEWGETEGKDGWVTVCMLNHFLVCITFPCPQDGSGALLLWKHTFKLPLHPHSLLGSSPPPPDITPFSLGSADSRMSVCHEGQRESTAELCSAQTDRPGWVLHRERRRRQCGGVKKMS